MRKLAVVTVLLAGLAGGLSYRYLRHEPISQVTQIAPSINFQTVDNKMVSLVSLRGHWVLINFWASWCAPCMNEIPHLVRAQSEYSSLGLKIIGPALDDLAAVKPLLTRFQFNYPVTADFAGGERAMRALGNDKGALPFSVLIDPDGFVAERVLGGMSAEQLDALLNRHIGRS
jgi:peroxiredoxin